MRYRGRLITGSAKRWLAWRSAAAGPRETVLIIGGGETGQFAAWILGEGKYASQLRVAGFIDDDLFTHGTRIRGRRVLGGRADIPRLVQEQDIGIILFAIHNITSQDRRQLLDICSSTGARLVVFPDIPAALSGIARKPGERRSAIRPSPSTPLPCHLCLTRVSPMKIDGWLAQIQESANQGDLESLQEQIQAFREQMSAEIESQLAVEPEGDRD